MNPPYTPSTRQLLAHNFLQAYDGDNLNPSILAADPETSLFAARILTGLAGILNVTISTPEEALSELAEDLYDLIAASNTIAYRRSATAVDPHGTSPYKSYSTQHLRDCIVQSDHTLKHFIATSASIFLNSAEKAANIYRSYLNMRYGTAVYLIESYPLSGNETVKWINKEEYFYKLEQVAADVLM